jgi:hypothetical protein
MGYSPTKVQSILEVQEIVKFRGPDKLKYIVGIYYWGDSYPMEKEFYILLDWPQGQHILYHRTNYSEAAAKDVCALLGIEFKSPGDK